MTLINTRTERSAMAYSNELLNKIYDRTDGYCHLCGKKLSFVNYGKCGRKGVWQVEHSRAKANGGTNHPNNLFAACTRCNQEKGIVTTRTARGWNGRTKAPLSKVKKQAQRKKTRLNWRRCRIANRRARRAYRNVFRCGHWQHHWLESQERLAASFFKGK